jgi:hypothetical protein
MGGILHAVGAIFGSTVGAVAAGGLLLAAAILGYIWWSSLDGDDAGPPLAQPTIIATQGSPPPNSGTVVPAPAGSAPGRDTGGSGAPTRCQSGKPCLRVTVNGPGSVQIDSPNVICPPACEISYPGDVQTRILRRQGLTPEQREGARISAWGGDCRLDAQEPICMLTMDRDHNVTVTFEIRPRVRISATGQSGQEYQLLPSTQQAGGGTGPTGRKGCPQTPCVQEFYYDLGTQLEINPINRDILRRWEGACAGTQGTVVEDDQFAEPCHLTLTGDVEVGLFWSIPRCQITVFSDGSETRSCTYDPP